MTPSIKKKDTSLVSLGTRTNTLKKWIQLTCSPFFLNVFYILDFSLFNHLRYCSNETRTLHFYLEIEKRLWVSISGDVKGSCSYFSFILQLFSELTFLCLPLYMGFQIKLLEFSTIITINFLLYGLHSYCENYCIFYLSYYECEVDNKCRVWTRALSW